MFNLDLVLPLLAALGCGLVAGVLFAFSSFVMPALDRLNPPQSIAAMQSINITVINVSFMGVFFGTAALCIAIAVRTYYTWQRPGAALALAGAALYVVGTIVVTAAFHVPRNDALAAIDVNAAGSAEVWRHYSTAWTAGNHVRAAAALVAGALLTLSLIWPGRAALQN